MLQSILTCVVLTNVILPMLTRLGCSAFLSSMERDDIDIAASDFGCKTTKIYLAGVFVTALLNRQKR